MRNFIERSADFVCFSGHKFLSGSTSGIIAGRRDLVEACLYHQYYGIGRAMKVGKEGIVGVMAALEQWERLDHKTVQAEQKRIVNKFVSGLKNVLGLTVTVEPDPTENPVQRVKVQVDPRIIGLTAFQMSAELAAGDSPIIVRDHQVIDENFFFLDPCNVNLEQAEIVVKAIKKIVDLPDEAKQKIRQTYPPFPNSANLLVAKLQSWIPE